MDKLKFKLKMISYAIIFLMLIQVLIPIVFNSKTYAATTNDDIYDVILFWGQSNMVGSCYPRKESELRFNPEDSTEVKNYSKISGISEDILSKNSKTSRNMVFIPQKSKTVYEYVYTNDNIKEITETTMQYGEHLIYNISNENLEIPQNNSIRSLSASKGTNIIPEFSRTYYEKTGHKVVAVLAAREGKPIRQFLPYDDKENTVSEKEKGLRLYESIKEKYNKAINYLNRNNYKIGTKMYVAFQGEADVGNTIETTNTNYYNQFMKVHNYLKKDLGIQKGAIVETARASGTYRLDAVNIIHQAQERLIKGNSDIILGSTFFYDKYIPIENDYNKCNTKITFDSNGNKISYQNALEKARMAEDYINEESRNNAVHLISAALSQVGRETAQNLAKTIDKTIPQITKVTATDGYKTVTNVYSNNKLQGNNNISNNWFKGPVTLKFEARDNESGIKSYWINTNGKSGEKGQSKKITTTTKNIKLTVYNNADLKSVVNNININIDTVKPTLQLNTYQGKGVSKWVSSQVEASNNRSCYIALSPSDGQVGSGIKMQYKYRINGGQWQIGYTRNYKNELVYCFKQNGKYEFKVEDKAGNESNIYKINITKVDSVCPKFTVLGENGKLTIKAEDAESGLSKYTIDGKTWISWPSGKTEVQIKKENATIKAGTIKVQDIAENETSWNSQINTGVPTKH